ncbi:MAG TPA: hypothetical protein VII56_05340 [Rhizomicrobium sp.]
MTQPVEILYAVPVGTVIAWYPLPGTALPPGFAYCDGTVVSDAESPYNGKPTPNLTNRFILGDIPGSTLNTLGGSTQFNLTGWGSATLPTSTTQVLASDNVPPNIIQHNNTQYGTWRYVLTGDGDGWNDGNHHHTVNVTVPAPGWLNLVYIIRIK